MTTLEVPVKISAIDNLTGGLSSIAGKIGQIQGQFASAGRTMAGFGMQSLQAIAGPAEALAFFAASNQKELDKQLRLFQAFGDATDDQRKNLRSLVNEIAPKIGMSHLALIKGATESIQAGLDPADILFKNSGGITFLERLGLAAKGANESIDSLITDLAQLATIGKFPTKTSGEKMSTYEMLAGIALTAPALSPDKPRQHMMALAQFAPLLIPKLIGDNPTQAEAYDAMLQASALQNTVAFGFRGQLGGMGLKTILQRIMNPTEAAQQQMMLGGFNYGRVFNFDASKANSPDKLIQSLLAGGVDASSSRGTIAKHLGGLTNDTELLGFKGKLVAELGDELGLKKGNSRDRGILKRGIDNFIAVGQGKFSIENFLEELTKMSPQSLKDLAGLHHAPKASILQGLEALTTYRRMYEEETRRAPGAIDRMAGIRNDPKSWDFQLDRFDAAKQTLQNRMWDAGSGSIFIGIIEKLSDAMLKLSAMEPSKLDAITNSLILMGGTTAALAGLGVTLGAMTPALRLLASPIGAGTLGAMLLGSALYTRPDRVDVPDIAGGKAPLPGLWNWVRGKMGWGGGGDVPVAGVMGGGTLPLGAPEPTARLGMSPALMGPIKAELEGAGEVIITIQQDGSARVTGMRSGGNIRLKQGESMTDTGR